MDDHHLHSQRHHPIQFQLPQFVYSSAPTLVPGGGAEVIPLTNPEWFVNNGFTLSPGNHFFAQQQPPALNDHVGESTSSPFDFAETEELTFPPPAPPTRPDLHLLSSLSVPSPFGLPVYSVSGFDIVSILSRVHHRPNATVHLGPVDLTCSFVVVDPRRYDHPIVYCSPTFCTLTGYAEAEVLGRNCRFLQAPGGMVAKGEQRKFTSGESVGMLRKAIASGKDVQTSIVNYKKNGAAFINLVTVITVNGEGEEGETPWYYVGFQVDLTEQPNAILEKLRDGTYAHFEPPPPRVGAGVEGGAVQNGANNVLVGNTRDKKGNAVRPVIMSKELKRLLADPSFLRSFPLPHDPSSTSISTANTTSTPTSSSTEDPTSTSANAVAAAASANHLLHLFLLEASPDFIHVVSLKGSFLYVAPSVRRVLGYEAHEMVGRCLADYAHPEDVVPLMRELKESSATGIGAGFVGGASGSGAGSNTNGNHNANGNTNSSVSGGELQTAAGGGTGGMPRSVDLLFRAKTKMGRYVWVECRGRLHVEPGKGRKAIILTGRAREMMSLRWEDVREAGGLARSVRVSVSGGVGSPAGNGNANGTSVPQQQGQERREERREVSQEVWGLLGGTSRETATFLTAGVGMRDVLGWTAEEVVGRGVRDFVVDSAAAGAGAGAEGMEGIGAVVKGMRVFQRERRRRGWAGKGKGKEAGDPARWSKVRCLMRTRDGGCVDVWFVVYRADLEDESGDRDQDLEGAHDGEEKQGQGRRKKVRDGEAGMSISPAALVYQIRRVDAETVECGPMPPTTEAALGLGGGGVSSSSSSTKNAASLVPTTSSGPAAAGSSSSPSSSSSSSAVAEQTRPAPALPTPSLDMFEELSIARGTSWQYELQQLRFANARLEEEIAGLEAVVTDADDAKRKVRGMEREKEVEKGKDKEELKQERVGVESIQTAANASVNVNVEYVPYEEPTYADVSQQQQQQQQQLFSRGQLVVHQHQQHQQQPPQDSYAQHASRGGLYEALGGVGVVGDETVAGAGSGREEATGATAYLHQPKPQYSLGGRTVLPLPLQRERERERYTSSSLQYPPQQQQQQQLQQQQLHNYQLSPLQQHREFSRTGSHAQARPQAHTHTLPRPQPQTWGTMTVPPLQLQSPMLIYSRHSNSLHRQQDMDMDMDVESMYAAVGAGADAGGASGMSPAVGPPGVGAGLSSGSSLVPPNTNASSSWNSSLKRSWSAVGS